MMMNIHDTCTRSTHDRYSGGVGAPTSFGQYLLSGLVYYIVLKKQGNIKPFAHYERQYKADYLRGYVRYKRNFYRNLF